MEIKLDNILFEEIYKKALADPKAFIEYVEYRATWDKLIKREELEVYYILKENKQGKWELWMITNYLLKRSMFTL